VPTTSCHRYFGAVSLTAAFYVANKVGASLRENVVDFAATFIAGVFVLAGLRGWRLLRDAGDRRFIERQQREIREEAAARAAADQLQRPT
jgi:hypothetical protein